MRFSRAIAGKAVEVTGFTGICQNSFFSVNRGAAGSKYAVDSGVETTKNRGGLRYEVFRISDDLPSPE